MSDYLPALGRHLAICRSIQFGWTSDRKEQIVLDFEFTGESDPDRGEHLAYFGTFTEAAAGKKAGAIDFTEPVLRLIGWEGDDMTELPTLAASGILSKEVEIVVDHETYEGKVRAKAKWINRPGGGAVQIKTPMTERELAAFAAAMRQRLRGTPRTKQSGGAPPRAAPAKHPNAPDDDIPFISSLDSDHGPW